ncbi:DinB family protein [Paenibacillus sp. FJAT-26967]|uniref:DinB family protein n=1 Tax=Paenibacillus sp. FJAT-26967 TaxID=1729690 RepID=UPI0008380756|nr:DinB family protein [Paenibacillus sp. FJAT-26967]
MTTPVTMYHFHAWATQTIIDRLKELPAELYTQEIQSSSFASLSRALAHIYLVDVGWLDILNGKDMMESMTARHEMQEEIESKSLSELEALFKELTLKYQTFFAKQPDLEKTILLDNPYADSRNIRLSQIVFQVVNHGTYHRGNITTMLRQTGHASTMTEYALFWYQEDVPLRSAASL